MTSTLLDHPKLSSSLVELAARVEKLTGSCRETDALIAIAIDARPDWLRGDDRPLVAGIQGTGHVSAGKHGPGFAAFDYTASLDAAMTLARTSQEAYQATQDALRAIAVREFLHCRFYTGSFTDDLARNVSAILLRARAGDGK